MTATPAPLARITFAARHPWLARPWVRPVTFGGAFLLSLVAKNALGTATDGVALAALFAVVLLVLGSSLILAVPVRVEVGADGVLLGWSGLTRFIAFREIDAVELAGKKIVLVRSKRRLYLEAVEPRRRPGVPMDRRALDAPAAMQDRLEAVRQAGFPRELEELLACGARSPAVWFKFLEERGMRLASYRDAAPDREALCGLALSPAALASARAAAAWILLRSGLLPKERHLLLGSALSSVDPELRSALSAIAGAASSAILASTLLRGVARTER